MADRQRPALHLPGAGGRRATVIGAGSFGTAVAVLLARGGFRTTLQARTREQADTLSTHRENAIYLPGVQLPRELRIGSIDDGLERTDFVFLGVPSRGLDEGIKGLVDAGLSPRTYIVSLAKGLVPPDGQAPTVMLRQAFGARRVACIGGPPDAPPGGVRGGPPGPPPGGRGRRPGRRVGGRGARANPRRRLHPRGRRLRALQRPGRRRAGGRGQERGSD